LTIVVRDSFVELITRTPTELVISNYTRYG